MNTAIFVTRIQGQLLFIKETIQEIREINEI